MPIPAFDHNYVLPPHVGDPALGSRNVSPYPTTSMELANHFATSQPRIQILIGFFNFREQIRAAGMTQGFQWLDGSFMEDIETQEGRAPRDLDLLTLYWGYDLPFQIALSASVPAFRDRDLAKANFHLDHIPLDIGADALYTVEATRYWVQLFTHNRNKVWKGMLRIELDTPVEDAAALKLLQNLLKP